MRAIENPQSNFSKQLFYLHYYVSYAFLENYLHATRKISLHFRLLLKQLILAGTCSWIHGDCDKAVLLQLQSGSLELEQRCVCLKGLLYGEDLLCHHREHFYLYPVELVETRPASGSSQTFEELQSKAK